MTYDEFIENYQPLKDDKIGVKRFETYGKEFDTVEKTEDKYIWTVIDNEGHDLLLTNGKWHINRFYYIICKIPFTHDRGTIDIII